MGKKNRILAAALAIVMTAGLLAVPAGAAVPLGGETEEHVHTHAAGPVLSVGGDEQASLLGCTCETTPHPKSALSSSSSPLAVEKGSVHYIAKASTLGTSNLFFNISGTDMGTSSGWTFEGVWNTDKTTTNGTSGIKCRFSGDGTAYVKNGSEVILTLIVGTPTHNHSWDTTAAGADADGWVTTKAPTCSAAGTKERTCTADGCPLTNNKEQGTISALGHKWDSGVETKAPTCTEAGVRTFTCSVCKATKPGVIDPAHKYNDSGVCSVCGQHQHKWDSGTITTPATCSEEGEKTFHCTVDGCTETTTQPIPATGEHNFKDGVCTVCHARETTGFLTAAGDLETAYALWPIGAGATKYEAYVAPVGGSYTPVDAHLVREYPGYMRVDVLGLKAGQYTIKVKDNNGKELVTDPLTVKAHDRIGFAFAGGKTASGAYNNDGTLKSNAKVVYITTDAELAALLNSSSIWSGKGESTPTCVRIIGKVKASDVLGFQEWTSGLTVEGVGNDATLTGGGVFVKASSNVEVRNLAVFHVHSGGKNDLIAIEQDNDHIWVHNCDLFYGFSGGGDQAKGDGSLDVKDTNYSTFSYNHFWDSGKCSLLGNNSSEDYISYHHNWFDHSDSRHPRIRGGVNGGNIHVFNNYYDGVSKYGVGTTSDDSFDRSSVFIEGNYFRNTKYPIMNSKQGSDSDGKGGTNTFSKNNPGFNKVWNNIMVGSKNFISQNDNSNSFDGYVVSSRDEKVPSTVRAYAYDDKGNEQGSSGYNNFDTSIDLGVTAAQIQSPADARTTVTQWAGRVQGGDLVYEFDNDTQDTNYTVIKELDDMLTNYKTSLVSVGGTVTNPVSGGSTPVEHTHTPGPWVIVTPAGCDPETKKLVNGEETQSCTICGQLLTTRSVPGAHSNDGSGKCTVCGETVANNEGPGSTTSGPTLQAKNFKMTDVAQSSSNKNQEDLLASEIADVADGYFSLTPGAKSVYKRTKDATTTGNAAEWIQLPKEGTGGIQFTVKNGPATLKVKFSSSSATDGAKTAAIQVKDAGGNAVADKDGKTPSVTQKTSKESNAITVTFENLAAGTTYQILGAPSSGSNPQTARVYSVTVVEAESTCDHATSTHHPAVDATCATDGNIEYWTCDNCKKNFSDAAMTKVVDDVTTEATGDHDWGDWEQDDTDSTLEHRYCNTCDTEESREVEKLIHLVEGQTDLIYTHTDSGDITMTSVPTGHTVIAAYAKDGKFVGARVMDSTHLNATAVPGGWTLLKLFWLDNNAVPQSMPAEIEGTGGSTPTPDPDPDPDPEPATPITFAASQLTAEGDKEALSAADAAKFSGFTFDTITSITKRVDKNGAVTSVELVKAAGSAIRFTVSKGTATAKVTVSSTGSVNWSAVQLEKKNGDNWEPVNATITPSADLKLFGGSTSVVLVYNTAAQDVSYANLAAGTYRVVVPDMGDDLYTKQDGTKSDKATYEALDDKVEADKTEKGLYAFNRNLRIQSVTVTPGN